VFSSLPASSRIDAVVSNLNGPALGKAQLALIDAAKEARVKRFLPSEFGSDTNNEKVLEMVELLKGKKRIVDYLRTKEGDGFTWTAVITGLFLDYVGSKYTLVFADVIHYFRCRVSKPDSNHSASRRRSIINGTTVMFPLALSMSLLSAKPSSTFSARKAA